MLLDKSIIYNYVGNRYKFLQEKTEILSTIDSTNRYLQREFKASEPIRICFAETQTAGIGRRGNSWFSPPASNIYLSIAYIFSTEVDHGLAGLSLVAAIATAAALQQSGVNQVQIKWPNDLVWHQQKLGGILTEIDPIALSLSLAVVGIGLNVNMQQQTTTDQLIGQPWCDVAQIIGQAPDRNQLAGLLLNQLLISFERFQQAGLAAFHEQWQQLDSVYGKEVTIISPQKTTITGIGWGIDNQGKLLLKQPNGIINSFICGEVSLRMQPTLN